MTGEALLQNMLQITCVPNGRQVVVLGRTGAG